MENLPTVSVIIPTYNRAELVRRAIQSALEQTFQDYEVIVVDDGSTDNTREVVGEFVKQDQRVKFIQHETNKGVSAARNTAILQARGEYIAFLDSDCTWAPEKVEKQLKAFAEGGTKLGAVAAEIFLISRKDKIPKKRIGVSGDIYKKLLAGVWPGGPQTVVIKKECFEKVGLFDETFPAMEDLDLYLRIAKHYHFDIVAKPLVGVERKPDSLSLNSLALFIGMKRTLEKYQGEFPRFSPLRSRFAFSVGLELCRQGEMGQGRRYLLQAILANPRRIGMLPAVIASMFPYFIFKSFEPMKAGIKRIFSR